MVWMTRPIYHHLGRAPGGELFCTDQAVRLLPWSFFRHGSGAEWDAAHELFTDHPQTLVGLRAFDQIRAWEKSPD